MLKIRLQKIGKKNSPSYRVVLVEHTFRPQGKYIEDLGSYNPKAKQKNFNKERILYWISKGAQVSSTVHNFLVDEKIIDKAKIKAWKPKKKKVEESKTAPTPEGVGVPASPPEAESVGKEPKAEEPKVEETKVEEPKSESVLDMEPKKE